MTISRSIYPLLCLSASDRLLLEMAYRYKTLYTSENEISLARMKSVRRTDREGGTMTNLVYCHFDLIGKLYNLQLSFTANVATYSSDFIRCFYSNSKKRPLRIHPQICISWIKMYTCRGHLMTVLCVMHWESLYLRKNLMRCEDYSWFSLPFFLGPPHCKCTISVILCMV